MRPTSADRLGFQSALADTRLGGRLIYFCVPRLVRDQSFDPDTQSGGDISDGLGLGQEPESWVVYGIYANVRNVDQSLKTFGQAPPGAEVGDTFITIGLRDKQALEQVKANQHGYIEIDGDRFRPTDISAAGVGKVEEWVISLQRYSPVFVARGR